MCHMPAAQADLPLLVQLLRCGELPQLRQALCAEGTPLPGHPMYSALVSTQSTWGDQEVEFLLRTKPAEAAATPHTEAAARAVANPPARQACDTSEDVVVLGKRPARAKPAPRRRPRLITAVKTPPGRRFELRALAQAHPERTALQQFIERQAAAAVRYGWRGPGPAGGLKIQSVFKVQPPAAVVRRFEAYAASKAGTIRRCFHGTSMACNLAMIESVPDLGPCGQSNCAACNICTIGLSRERTAHNAIFVSEQPAIAAAYGRGRATPSLGAYPLFICDVAAGAIAVGNHGHSSPPRGYDSCGVHAQVRCPPPPRRDGAKAPLIAKAC
eukprot:TRINITY_DN357_c0_g1_i1.p1 TRINITY_DN357_c0_g1~~TRINITY_DN357_c0_g1_i1.p1  ORF type:complete len:328 (-),score=60.15 TRINITY_DN357_c0_g1_i1:375-1358(-)